MKLIELKCKNCGAILKVDENSNNVNCEFCHAKFKLDDEVKHVQYDNMEQSGYEFEKGRLRAQQELKRDHNKSVEYVQKEKKKHNWFVYFLYFMFFPFVITYYVAKSSKLSKKAKIIVLGGFWIFIFIIMVTSEMEEKSLEKDHWATDCTKISDFSYIIDGNDLILKDYNGSSKRIKVCSTYNIDDVEYTVTKFSEGVFALQTVYSVILPDTLQTMASNTFNSSGIKYVYIPKSLQKNDKGSSFYSYFHGVETIYYGGSEEEWKILTDNIDREKIDSKNIVYNSKIEDLK